MLWICVGLRHVCAVLKMFGSLDENRLVCKQKGIFTLKKTLLDALWEETKPDAVLKFHLFFSKGMQKAQKAPLLASQGQE